MWDIKLFAIGTGLGWDGCVPGGLKQNGTFYSRMLFYFPTLASATGDPAAFGGYIFGHASSMECMYNIVP